jgi:uncharacterized membrane protein YbhN (UPF0104 family)
MNRTRFSHIGSVLLSFLLFALSLWAINQELRQHSISEIWGSLRAIPESSLLLAVGLTSLNYLVMTGYDTVAVRFVRHPLPYLNTAIAAIITYGVSNSVGLALLSGSAIRYRFYRAWGLSVVQIAQIVAFCNLSFWLGLFVVGGLLFLVVPVPIPKQLQLPFTSVHSIGVIFLLVVFAYLLVTVRGRKPFQLGKWTLPHLPPHLCLAQLVVGSLDWTLAASVLYVLLAASAPLPYGSFFSIYLLAQFAGVISNVPGGLGVFETVMLLLLSSSISSASLFGALLVYRGIYYFLPLIVAMLLLGFYEIRRKVA